MMGFIRYRQESVGIALCFMCATSVQAERHAMIVSGRAGDQQQSDKNKAYCRQTKDLLETVGFDRVSLFFEGKEFDTATGSTNQWFAAGNPVPSTIDYIRLSSLADNSTMFLTLNNAHLS